MQSTESMKGGHVKGTQGEDLGTIREVMIDLSAGRVAYAVVSFGGFLGIGARSVALPWDALRASSYADEYVTDISKDRLKEAPSFDRSKWSSGADQNFLNNLYTYYGCTPYWNGSEDDSEESRIEDQTPSYAGSEHDTTRRPAVIERIETVTETTTTEYGDLGEVGGFGNEHFSASASDLEPRSQRTAASSSGGGMSDTDMDQNRPGGNIRTPESQSSETPSPSAEQAYSGSQEQHGELSGFSKTSHSESDIWYREGGAAQSSETERAYGGSDFSTGEGRTESPSEPGATPYGGSDSSSSQPSGAATPETSYGGPGNAGGAGEFEDSANEGDAFNATSGGSDQYSDTSGANENVRSEDIAFSDNPEGQGNTRAFEVGEDIAIEEDISAVSGFGSTSDIANLSGVSGPSAANLTGGSEGLSAAEDLSIGSVDDLNTAGSTLGLDDIEDEDISERDDRDDLDTLPGEGRRRGSSASGDFRTNEDENEDLDRSDPNRSGRGHSGGHSSRFGMDSDEEKDSR
jgi:sporulation protein YlmC with PRC-barrel domain